MDYGVELPNKTAFKSPKMKSVGFAGRCQMLHDRSLSSDTLQSMAGHVKIPHKDSTAGMFANCAYDDSLNSHMHKKSICSTSRLPEHHRVSASLSRAPKQTSFDFCAASHSDSSVGSDAVSDSDSDVMSEILEAVKPVTLEKKTSFDSRTCPTASSPAMIKMRSNTHQILRHDEQRHAQPFLERKISTPLIPLKFSGQFTNRAQAAPEILSARGPKMGLKSFDKQETDGGVVGKSITPRRERLAKVTSHDSISQSHLSKITTSNNPSETAHRLAAAGKASFRDAISESKSFNNSVAGTGRRFSTASATTSAFSSMSRLPGSATSSTIGATTTASTSSTLFDSMVFDSTEGACSSKQLVTVAEGRNEVLDRQIKVSQYDVIVGGSNRVETHIELFDDFGDRQFKSGTSNNSVMMHTGTSTECVGGENRDPGESTRETLHSPQASLPLIRSFSSEPCTPWGDQSEVKLSLLNSQPFMAFRHRHFTVWPKQTHVHKDILFCSTLCGVQPPVDVPAEAFRLFAQKDKSQLVHAYLDRVSTRFNLAPTFEREGITIFWWRAVVDGIVVVQNFNSGKILAQRASECSLPAAAECLSTALARLKALPASFLELDPDFPSEAIVKEEILADPTFMLPRNVPYDVSSKDDTDPTSICFGKCDIGLVEKILNSWADADGVSPWSTKFVIKLQGNQGVRKAHVVHMRYSIGVAVTELDAPLLPSTVQIRLQVHRNEPLSRSRKAYPLCMTPIVPNYFTLLGLRVAYRKALWFLRKLYDVHEKSLEALPDSGKENINTNVNNNNYNANAACAAPPVSGPSQRAVNTSFSGQNSARLPHLNFHGMKAGQQETPAGGISMVTRSSFRGSAAPHRDSRDLGLPPRSQRHKLNTHERIGNSHSALKKADSGNFMKSKFSFAGGGGVCSGDAVNLDAEPAELCAGKTHGNMGCSVIAAAGIDRRSSLSSASLNEQEKGGVQLSRRSSLVFKVGNGLVADKQRRSAGTVNFKSARGSNIAKIATQPLRQGKIDFGASNDLARMLPNTAGNLQKLAKSGARTKAMMVSKAQKRQGGKPTPVPIANTHSFTQVKEDTAIENSSMSRRRSM